MARDRAWRRHIEEKYTIRRLRTLKIVRWYWRGFLDVNNIRHNNLKVSDYIGTKDYFLAKTLSTSPSYSRHKLKYSPNKSKVYYRDYKKQNTREYNTKLLRKILIQNGII